MTTGRRSGALTCLAAGFVLGVGLHQQALGDTTLQFPPKPIPYETAPLLGLPIDCRSLEDCSVQNFFDHAAGPEARDHTCGPLAYNGHAGIDIRVPTLRALERGMAVIAAADGVVIATRNNVPDKMLSQTEARLALGQATKPSNSVSIHHGSGWITHYGHLRRGSVSVEVGQKVRRGESLGLIGLSGTTSFPHLHFALQHRDRIIDPYTGREAESGCGQTALHVFWSDEAASLLPYRPSGMLDAGFAMDLPTLGGAMRGEYAEAALAREAPHLAFWITAWGLRDADLSEMRLYAPDGSLLADTTETADQDMSIQFRFLAVRQPPGGWPVGLYRGEYLLRRAQETGETAVQEVLRIVREVEVR